MGLGMSPELSSYVSGQVAGQGAMFSSAGVVPLADGNNSTSNLGSGSFGWKNFYLSDATNRAQFLVSNSLYASYPSGQSFYIREASTDRVQISPTTGNLTALTGDVIISTSGKTISIQEATAASACMGTATPNGTTNVTVTTSCAVSGARIFYSRVGAVTNMASISTTTAPNGTNFTFASTGATDTLASSVVWWIIKESA